MSATAAAAATAAVAIGAAAAAAAAGVPRRQMLQPTARWVLLLCLLEKAQPVVCLLFNGHGMHMLLHPCMLRAALCAEYTASCRGMPAPHIMCTPLLQETS
jgi:hypothetical protein